MNKFTDEPSSATTHFTKDNPKPVFGFIHDNVVADPPEYSDWYLTLRGIPYKIAVSKGYEPNWFHRKMQKLCFGFTWKQFDKRGRHF